MPQTPSTKSPQDPHLAPNTCWKFRFGPLSKGHCVTRCFSNISIVVTLSHTMRACIPSSPPRLRANAISTMNANRVSANLQQQKKDPRHLSHNLSPGLS